MGLYEIQRRISAEEHARRQAKREAALVWRVVVALIVLSWVGAAWLIAACYR